MPDLIKQPKANALAELTRAGLSGNVEFDKSLCGSTVNGQIVELGEVCFQSPAAGTTQSSRVPITLRVQDEDPRHGKIGEHMEWHLVPKVIGMTLADAKKAMVEAGFRNEQRTQVIPVDDQGCEAGHVCRTMPSPMERSGLNSDRILYVRADQSVAAPPTTAGD
jgi:beta-lactam-binding protein with PASTA domain